MSHFLGWVLERSEFRRFLHLLLTISLRKEGRVLFLRRSREGESNAERATRRASPSCRWCHGHLGLPGLPEPLGASTRPPFGQRPRRGAFLPLVCRLPRAEPTPCWTRRACSRRSGNVVIRKAKEGEQSDAARTSLSWQAAHRVWARSLLLFLERLRRRGATSCRHRSLALLLRLGRAPFVYAQSLNEAGHSSQVAAVAITRRRPRRFPLPHVRLARAFTKFTVHGTATVPTKYFTYGKETF